jgi:hypothetical protein
MGSPWHPQVAEWLTNLDNASRAEVDEALSYLREHGRGAALPDVRHRIPSSRHFPDMSELKGGATMSNLPEGWDTYDPDDHERSASPGYQAARDSAAQRAERRRGAYGEMLASLRRARSLTQVVLAEQLGVAQGEVSRVEHQSDLLLTFTRYIEGMGGDMALVPSGFTRPMVSRGGRGRCRRSPGPWCWRPLVRPGPSAGSRPSGNNGTKSSEA